MAWKERTADPTSRAFVPSAPLVIWDEGGTLVFSKNLDYRGAGRLIGLADRRTPPGPDDLLAVFPVLFGVILLNIQRRKASDAEAFGAPPPPFCVFFLEILSISSTKCRFLDASGHLGVSTYFCPMRRSVDPHARGFFFIMIQGFSPVFSSHNLSLEFNFLVNFRFCRVNHTLSPQ